jgi:hypothetical protein
MFSKRKVRGLYGCWTDALYSIDIDHFEAFLKQQKRESKATGKHSSQTTISSSNAATNGADGNDLDEELPDVDPSHEQLNLPANSITLWKILPKLDHAPQVSDQDNRLNVRAFKPLLILVL